MFSFFNPTKIVLSVLVGGFIGNKIGGGIRKRSVNPLFKKLKDLLKFIR